MKKFVSSLVVLLLVLSCTTALAAYEAPVIFSSVCNYGDTVYTVPEADYSFYSELKGGNIRLSQLPKAITSRSSSVDYGHVTSFCCYNNKIYFTVCVDDNTRRSKIFSCNMDGSNITFLADYAQPFYSAWIVDNVLYYASDTPFYRYSNLPAGYYDGLHSINLKDLSWKKLSNQILVSICYCDGEYLYCYTEANHGVFAIKADGSQKISVTGCCDEFAGLEGNQQGFLKGNLFYYLKDNSHVYVRDKNGGNDRWLGRIPPSDRAYIESVTDDHIYCVTINFSDPSEQIVYEIDR